MLSDALAQATVPAENLDRGVKFYTEVLGLKRLGGVMEEVAIFQAGKGSQVLMYPRGRTKADHTAITFVVEGDLEPVVDGLIARGVTFEQYDMGPIKTNEKGIASLGSFRMAWLTDPEGNILGISGT
jgi:predicted enzyme related to lactoylglutathione lyase